MIETTLSLRRLHMEDNAAIARLIRQVSAEFGLTADKGYAVADPNLDRLYETYSQPRHAYWVVEQEGNVVGGGGIAPLLGSEPDICELQKMYFLPQARGQGQARKLALMAMEFAREHGFRHCYLETTASLKQAIALYQRLGFTPVRAPLGNTGHVDCEVRMIKTLEA
ncbi:MULTISPECIES: GNAT family N-acetyltransferase [Tenebrionibacter/Tenebrionicola group]|jgi:putative acetyltransferase|uniref:GNAT family N-acetyltransferase n=2 Tax=Tenebrionibacter/Tenebrionicola group TaxID=2969848 RepID=A0A8K0V607_9ENTR|nr:MULTISPECIES: GNAT family N-acetyltransferase [Tenebrionibacter/Tenebrionicola group]MBK4715634.1 GNAT family N-acetyltransferase [Tenebrionibacter intestinalis]MBV4412940.1 GNAT family N-acetyltransferase [Tenebrionicola larvae]MBV5094582.1 GNAT family N-acetyltransferase [Tenebrionicola larvae]